MYVSLPAYIDVAMSGPSAAVYQRSGPGLVGVREEQVWQVNVSRVLLNISTAQRTL